MLDTDKKLRDASCKPLYQPWRQEEFRADLKVTMMSCLQRWMYKTLLQEAFVCSTRPHLPDDDNHLWLLAGCENKKMWDKHKEVVRSVFEEIEEDGIKLLKHKRLSDDWSRLLAKREVRQVAGKKGGEAHREKQLLSNATAELSKDEAREEKLREVEDKDKNKEEDLKEIKTVKQGIIMKAKKEIPVISERVLGVKAETWQSTWEEVKILEGAFGGSAVCRVFEEWAQTKRGIVLDKPVTEFLKIGRGLLAGIISLSPDTELSDLVDELVYLSRGTVKFTDAQQTSLGKTLEKYPRSDIEAAFKNFYAEIKEDVFKMGQAGKLFTETVGQEVKVALRMKQERTSEETLMAKAREKMTQEANERVAEMLRKETEEKESSETELS